MSSIRWTISGERRPCAIWNDGKVSDEARTEWDIGSRGLFRFFPVWWGTLRIERETIGAVFEVAVSGGRYIWREELRALFLLSVEKAVRT